MDEYLRDTFLQFMTQKDHEAFFSRIKEEVVYTSQNAFEELQGKQAIDQLLVLAQCSVNAGGPVDYKTGEAFNNKCVVIYYKRIQLKDFPGYILEGLKGSGQAGEHEDDIVWINFCLSVDEGGSVDQIDHCIIPSANDVR